MLIATLLVLLAGLIHASWNVASKKTRAGADFVTAYSALSCVLYAPVACWAARSSEVALTGRALGLVTLSGLLHFCYALVLQRGYQRAELAVVYPTARGTGPLLSTVAAVWLLGERLTAAGVSGALLVVAGIALVSGVGGAPAEHDRARAVRGLLYGLTTGVLIACYTVVDALSVKMVRMPPVLVDYFSNLTRTLLLLPLMAGRRGALVRTFAEHRTNCLVVGALMPLSHIIVLYAVQLAPVSHIAPMREVSVLFGVAGAAMWLGEPFGWKRMGGAAAIVTGVVLLARA